MPRRSRREITDAFVRSAKPTLNGRASYADALVPGFELRVGTDGRRTFAFRYKDAAGASVRITLGQYSPRGAPHGLSLAAAREHASSLRVAVRQGDDPRAMQMARKATTDIVVVGDLIDSYLDASRQRVRASTWRVNQQRLDTHVRPRFGAVSVASLSRKVVRQHLMQIGDKHPATARGLAVLIGALFRYGRLELELDLTNPAEGLQRLFHTPSRDRVLSDEELEALWSALSESSELSLHDGTALCIKLTALTLQRAGEVAGIHDNELDLRQRVWILPAARAKNKREHLIPLSAPAIAVIERARAIRDGQRRKANLALTPAPLFPARDGFDASLDRHSVTRAMARLTRRVGIVDARLHDLRRTGATACTSERMAIPRLHVSAVLGHLSETSRTVTAVYDRHEYAAEKRRALDAWGALLQSIVGQKAPQI